LGFIVMLSAITALSPLGIDTSLPALPIMAAALHSSDALIQATLGAFMLAFAVGQPVVGPLSDYYGRRPVILGGLALFLAAAVVCALATDATVLVAARFVQGLGACSGGVVVRAMIRDIFTERTESARMQAYSGAIMGVVPMLAPLLGAALLPFGWRAIYIALTLAGAAMLVVAALGLPESLTVRAPSIHVFDIFARYGDFLRLPRSGAMCLLVACSFAGLFAMISGSPFVLVRELGLSNAAYGVAFAISSGAILTGSWLAGLLAHRIGSERLLRLGCIAGALAGTVMFMLTVAGGRPPAAWVFVLAMAAYAFTFGIILPNAFAAGMEHAGAMAGVAAGLLGATQMLGGALGSTVNGILPFKTYVDVGLSVGCSGLGIGLAYLWSCRDTGFRARTVAEDA
jgi:DHA1 family bicyclomycin/chloramphenicol resistance-like MFS transporter